MAAVLFLRACFFLLLLSRLPCGQGLGFHSDVHHAGGEGKEGGFRLYSAGQLHDILSLDSASEFSIRMGSDGHLRVRPLTSGVLNATWWPGRPLVGRKVPCVAPNGSVSETSLLAKVKAVRRVAPGLWAVQLEPARNADLIKNGVIQMQFSLGDIDLSGAQGDGAFGLDLLSGSEASTLRLHTDKVVMVTSAGQADTRVMSGEAAEDTSPSQAPGLRVSVTDFQESHRFHPSLQVDLSSECYTTKATVEVTLTGRLAVEGVSEVGVQTRQLVSSRPSRLLHRLPLLLTPSSLHLPPSSPLLHLVTSQSSATWVEVYVTTTGPLHVIGGFNASGNVVLESSTCHGEPPKASMNFTGWSVVPSPWSGHSHAQFGLQVSLYHEVRYESSLHWHGISEPVKSLPALVLSMKPTLGVRSSLTPDSVCLTADLHLDGHLHLEDKSHHRGGATLLGGRGLRGEAWSGRLFRQCSAPCPEVTPTSPGVSMETACGAPSAAVSREDPRFLSLRVVAGDEVDFQGEESNSAWCGGPGRSCPPCLPPSPLTPPCADRVMAPETARLLSRLSRLARTEWPQRRVVVEEAWDEPDELHPFGRHGNRSLHYEGRALLLTLDSRPNPRQLRRLAQLAVCAGFPFADVTAASVAVCTANVQSDTSTRHRRSVAASVDYEANFQKFIQSIASVPASPSLSSLPVGESHPPGKTLTQVLGPALSPGATPEQLYQYTFSDVQFPPEGQASSTCQSPPRQCQTSCQVSASQDPWDWCLHRALTPRMALRLRRLAVLLRQRSADVKAERINEGSFSDTESGRAMTLTLVSTSPVDGDQFSSLVKQAGFDFVTRTSASSLRVYVKRQEGYLARLVHYQSNSLVAVLSPSSDYDLPTSASTEPVEAEEAPLVDGHDSSLSLSSHFRVADFAHPDHRYFRLEPLLLDCLELAAAELGSPPRVEAGWAFRPAPVNRVNLSARPAQERENFQRGRAAFVKPPANRQAQEGLVEMGTALVSRCTPLLMRMRRKLGLGCHGDKLYVDVRGMTSEDADLARYVELWDVDNAQLHQSLSQLASQLSQGGPVIAPASETRACREPELGVDLSYFSFSLSPLCIAFSDDCQNTFPRRQEVAEEMARGLNSVLGRVVSPSAVSQAVRQCLVEHCGGCLGAGSVWKEKLGACARLVKLFTEHAPSPWGDTRDRGSFLNPHTPQSSLHALACQQRLCVENTQLYTLALTALHARYRPDPAKSREELLFSGGDNPSPLLELIQQELAYSVQGKVRVYLESEADLGVLKDTLKVLMVHNTQVTEVELHFADQVLQDRVLPRLQRHLESWALRACPRWSRFAVAPFSAHVIPPSRLKRSAELSRERNEARHTLHSWELDWLLRL